MLYKLEHKASIARESEGKHLIKEVKNFKFLKAGMRIGQILIIIDLGLIYHDNNVTMLNPKHMPGLLYIVVSFLQIFRSVPTRPRFYKSLNEQKYGCVNYTHFPKYGHISIS